MPLQKLQLRPGVNRESTTLANEGTWFEMDKVRFRSGYPEKLGGWVKDNGGYFVNGTSLPPETGSFWGVARSLFNWITLTGFNLMAIGTNLKYYIQQTTGGNFYDITPLRDTNTGITNAFTTTNASTTVVVNDPGHGGITGDFVTISGVSGAVNGIPASALNKEFRITYINTNTYSIVVSAPATSSGTAGTATFAYQIGVGGDVYTVGVGWGAGGWGGVTTGFPSTGWGSPAPAGVGVGVQLRLWSQDNFGDFLVLNPRGGALYLWVPSATPGVYNRAQVLSNTNTNTQDSIQYWLTDTSCPTVANIVATSDTSRFTIAFGCNDYGSAVLDPLLVRWSDQEDYKVWAPAATNQAGSFRLNIGSSIVGQLQSRQEILIWTDAALYSMQYLGPPFVWGFNTLADNISIAGPNATATAANIVYWMGRDKFYMYSGRVETLYCPLRQYIFGDINLDQAYQFFAGTNEAYNEIWWFYCSAGSTVVDRYVIYNHLEKIWSYGNLARTAWLDTPLRDFPVATGYATVSFVASVSGTTLTVTTVNAGNLAVGMQVVASGLPQNTTITALGTGLGGIGTYTLNVSDTINSQSMQGVYSTPAGLLIYHEDGVDDGTTNPPSPISSYIQSADFNIGDGHNYGFVWRMIPDITFDGSYVNNPSVTFTMRPRQNPGANYSVGGTPEVTSTQNYQGQRNYLVQQFTQIVYTRVRGRQMAFKISSEGLGVQWQLGVPSIDVRPDGRR